MSGIERTYAYQYETVAASQTAQVMGGNGKVGDFIYRLVCVVTTVATSQVNLLDGATSIVVLPANVASIGTTTITLECASQSGAWAITTGAGVAVIGIGIFSA